MSLTPRFNASTNLLKLALEAQAKGEPGTVPAAPPKKRARAKRPAPFSLRLSEAQRIRLSAEADGAPLGAYIKAKLLDGWPLERKRRKGQTVQDREAFAQALALLGRSHLSSNLNQIAHALNTGIWPVTPETEAELFAALEDVRVMRRLLFSALGYRSEGEP
jgi:Bacterial mobilisation protein (MobC).